MTEAQAKAARMKYRKDLIAAAKNLLNGDGPLPPGMSRNTLQTATNEFEVDNKGMVFAQLTDNATHPSGPNEVPLQPGVTNISNNADELKTIGINSNDLKVGSPYPTFQVYKLDPAVYGDDFPTYVVVARGTIPSSWADWFTGNFPQGVDVYSPYYQNAVSNILARGF
jgi:hypothetical protein